MTLDPRKYLIKDLINKSTPIEVWLQGTIEQTVGTDILIISDTTGRAKITKCDTAHGIIDKSSITKGNELSNDCLYPNFRIATVYNDYC